MHFWKKIQISIPDCSAVVWGEDLPKLKFLNPFALDTRADDVVSTAKLAGFQ